MIIRQLAKSLAFVAAMLMLSCASGQSNKPSHDPAEALMPWAKPAATPEQRLRETFLPWGKSPTTKRAISKSLALQLVLCNAGFGANNACRQFWTAWQQGAEAK